jgi:hypothetical protein
MTRDREHPADLVRWLAEHGYDPDDPRLLAALERALGRAHGPLNDEERHRVVEAVRLGFPDPDVRH